MRTSERLEALGAGVFARMDRRKQAYAASAASVGQPLIDLSLGSTDLQPPKAVLDVFAGALADPASAAYCLQAGTLPFREAVAAWVQRRFGVSVDPRSEVLLLVGSQEGTAHLPLALLNAGEGALVLDPCYPSHAGGVLLAGGRLRRLRLRADQGWQPHWDQLSDGDWEQLRLLVFGFPHNPTATVGGQEWLEEALARTRRHGLVLAHDNPYVDLALDGEAPALLRCPQWREGGIEFFSLSKAWCLGGFRLAFAVGAAPLIEALARVKAVIDFNQSLALQAGAAAALRDWPDWSQRLLPVYRARREAMGNALGRAGWNVPPPGMALYHWLPLPPALQGLGSEEACSQLLQRSGVALTPGVGFGPGGEGWLRLALVREEPVLLEAARRLAAAVTGC
jgi:aspartate/methionine/tyrosine aminotransferase